MSHARMFSLTLVANATHEKAFHKLFNCTYLPPRFYLLAYPQQIRFRPNKFSHTGSKNQKKRIRLKSFELDKSRRGKQTRQLQWHSFWRWSSKPCGQPGYGVLGEAAVAQSGDLLPSSVFGLLCGFSGLVCNLRWCFLSARWRYVPVRTWLNL